MEQFLVAAAVALAVVGVSMLLRRRARPDRPTQPRRAAVPAQLDRADFERPDAPWLVAVFSSATCLSCGETWTKVSQLESDAVATQDIEAGVRRDLHRRYGIEAVPIVVIADRDGVVRASFLGPPSAADLWATLADLREPGSVPPACDHHGTGTG